MKATGSREELIGCSDDAARAQSHESLRAPQDTPLTATEKKLLREYPRRSEELDINCVDPLNRSALIAAIENENIDLIRLLLEEGIRDALLHAIKEEYVEAVEILLEWEERKHMPGQPYILLDRGASLPVPHDVRCGCDECVASSDADSLRHSQARINAYRALTAPSLIALSSRDPLLTAFELSRELRRLSHMENEFHDQYVEMSARCQDFATSLLDHVRTSLELEVLLNHCPDGDPWQPGERQTLERLKLAIKYKQKKFVAHHNVQQLLAAIWYEGLPGFRRKGMAKQLFEVAKLGSMFPVYSAIYMFAPNSRMGQFMKKPFVKFIIHSSSYAFFLTLLAAASQRVEVLLLEWMGTRWMRRLLEEWHRKERGSLPGPVEFCVMGYILSLMWCEIRALWKDGLLEYITDLWNIVDFITNCFYMIWICLRLTSWYIVQREAASGLNPWYPRERWHPFDPMLLSEGAFAAGMIFSFLKLVHIFSVNPHLGPLQISLGRMIIDILKFFFIYSLVLFAFGCGMNQLLWYYADLERSKCYHLPTGLPDYDHEDKACSIWRRFSNLFETSQSLFWASFGLVDLANFELTGIKSFTRFWALLMFGSYSVINIIVLLNMLIAMMSNSYQIISERADTEWKFARTHLWMSYFEEGDTVPPPFNIIPTSKGDAERGQAQERHDTVMHLLVRRYVTAEQRKRDEFGISEDDVMEIRQDISSLRYEIIDILRTNGMRTPNIDPQDTQVGYVGKNKLHRFMHTPPYILTPRRSKYFAIAASNLIFK
ncbi:Transient receptor potential protein [Gryllus bimaculatus]|nr:Transient receptor potential protein [Gryllus bimaculatus]